MEATNEQLTQLLAAELAIDLKNRRPYAREIINHYGIELLPHSSEDTLLGEIYEWNHRNWNTENKNIIGYIAKNDTTKLNELLVKLKAVKKEKAVIPDFEFSKEEIIGLDLKIPALFNIGFNGDFKNAHKATVKVNGITKSRLTNYQEPGVEIWQLLSVFASENTKEYRQNIKSKNIATALFYATSVEIELEKDAGVNIGVSFDQSATVNVEVGIDTELKKQYKLSYASADQSPFAASLPNGKDFI